MREFRLAVTPSWRCNLRCLYCYESHAGNGVVSIERIRGWLRRMYAKHLAAGTFSRVERIQVVIVGGETLLFPRLLRGIIEAVDALPWPLPVYFRVVSNGTVIAGDPEVQEVIKWAARRLHLHISIDGLKAVHDRYRCGSYDAAVAGLVWALENVPELAELYVNMVYTPESMDSVAEGAISILKLGVRAMRVVPASGAGYIWTPELGAEIACQLCRIVEYVDKNLGHEAVKVVPLDCGCPENVSGILRRFSPLEMCEGADGSLSEALAPDGSEHMCMRFADMPCGAPSREELREAVLHYDSFLPDVCRGCPVSGFCISCLARGFQDGDGLKAYHARMPHCGAAFATAVAKAYFCLLRRAEEVKS